MSKTGLKIVLSDSITDQTLRKLDHYYGITFQVGVSNQGGNNGYYQLIGDDTLRSEMRFHNLFKPCRVKDGKIIEEMDQTKFSTYTLDGSDDCDILWCATQDIYCINGAKVNGIEIRAISDSPFSYEGVVATKHAAYGECIDFATLKNNVLRSIRDDSLSGSQGAGSGTWTDTSDYGNSTGYGYPRTLLSRFQFESYARARNTDSTLSYPYAPTNNLDFELLETLLMIEFRTKNIETLIGYSITGGSSPTAATWGTVTGVRVTSDGSTYTYGTLGLTTYLNGSTTSTNIWNVINGSNPLLKIFEPQIAISNGGTFESVKDSDGNTIEGMTSGVMTGIWTKTFSFTFTGSLTSGGTATTQTVDVCLRVPIYRGRHLWGGLTKWTAGYEAKVWLDSDGLTHHQIYRCPSIDDLISYSNQTTTISTSEKFAFESVYNDLGETPAYQGTANVGFGLYATECLSDENSTITTLFTKTSGGARGTYENAVIYSLPATAVDSYYWRGALLGEVADGGAGVFRVAFLYCAPSSVNAARGSGFRVALTV